MEFLSGDQKEKLYNFAKFVREELEIKHPPQIAIQNGKGKLKTTANYDYDTDDKVIRINGKNRALVDVMRSMSHELFHHKQWEEGKLKNPEKDGEDGSEIENEANSMSGILIRKYGKINPFIYDC
jgi:hypothetical protein